MSKQYVLTQADVDRLTLLLDRDPQYGTQGGSSNDTVNDPGKRAIYAEAHRFYNYQIRRWIDEVTR